MMANEFTPTGWAEEDEEPVTAHSDQVPSFYGVGTVERGDSNITVDEAETALDPETLSSGIANSEVLLALAAGGLFNADFHLGPPDPDSPIGPNNPLPFWRVGSDQPGPVAAYWVADTNAPSGYCIEFVAQAGATYEDDVFIEQIVPVAPRVRVLAATGLWSYETSPALLGYSVGKPFAYDGSAINTGYIAEQGTLAQTGSGYVAQHDNPEISMAPWPVPRNTRYQLAKFIARFQDDGAGSVKLYEAFAGRPVTFAFSATFFHEAIPDAEVNWLLPSLNSATTSSAAAIEQVVSPGFGWVESISVRISAARTSGQLDVSVYDGSLGADVGPTVHIDGTNDGYSTQPFIFDRDDIDYADNFLHPGDRLHVKSYSVGAGAWAPTTADGGCYVTFVFVDEDYYTNPN